MTPLWHPDIVQKLLFAPHMLLSAAPWRQWVEAHGGIGRAYHFLQGLPLKESLREVLDVIIAHPGASVTVYHTQLGLERSAYHYRRKQLIATLTDLLNIEAPLAQGEPQLPARRAALPRPVALALIGREAELHELVELAQQPNIRQITLLGAGGTGKTRLAIQLAELLAPQYADGQVFIPLGDITDPDLVPSTVARHLGLKDAADRSALDTLGAYLADRQMLIVLDNFEHVLSQARFLADLAGRTRSSTLLVTSRRALNIYGEQRYYVPPLAVPPDDGPISPAAAMRYDAVRLFAARVRQFLPRWELSPATVPLVAAICRQLDGLPLALELAAARAAGMPLATLRSRLGARFQMLTNGPVDLPERQRTLLATLDWSYDLLPADAQALLAALGVFVSGWDLDAAEAICAGAAGQILDALDVLVQSSMVVLRPTSGDTERFQMLETIRAYAAELLQASPDHAPLRERHASYYLALAERLEGQINGPDQLGTLERIAADYPNMRAALQWALDHGRRVLAERFCGALGRFWLMRGMLHEGRMWVGLAWQCQGPCEPLSHAKSLWAAAILAYDQGDEAQSISFSQQALALYRAGGDQAGMAMSLMAMGAVVMMRGEYERAAEALTEALALYRQLGDARNIGATLHNLGATAGEQGDFAQAEIYYAECLRIHRQSNDAWSLAHGLINYAMSQHHQGMVTAATRAIFAEGLGLMRQLKDTYGIARAYFQLGLLACDDGQFDQSYAYLRDSLQLQQQIGDKRGMINSIEGLARLCMAQGRFGSVARLLGLALALRGAVGVPASPVMRRMACKTRLGSRQHVAPQLWDQAWGELQHLSLDQGAALALRCAQPDPAWLARFPAHYHERLLLGMG